MSAVVTVDEIESWLGSSLPRGYREFLNTRVDDLTPSDFVLVYGRSSFIELNEINEAKEYCPGFVTIGNDNGDLEVAMSLEDESVYLVDQGSMQIDTAEPLGTVFSDWLMGNCPLPVFEHNPIEWPLAPLTPVYIYLERSPSSLSNLLMIKRHLGIDTSIAEMKASVENIPCRIADGISYAKAKVLCRLVNDQDSCVGIRLADDEAQHLPA